MKILKVNEKYNNKKIINFLQDNFTGLSTSTIYKTLRKKDIKINDKRISENCLLHTGDEIKIYITDNLLKNKLDIQIIYEDNNIIVFNKPSGIEVTGENSLSSYAQELFFNTSNPFVEPCHRLDRNTSGLVLFAKNESSLHILLDAFKYHLIEKHYICVVYGIPKNKSKKLESYLFKDSKKSMVYISDFPKQGYKKIVTSYNILKFSTKKNISLLDITLETGRTHQIRAHLAHIGYPILGDGKYGINKINKQFNKQTQLLASYSIKFNLKENTILSYLDGLTIKQPQIPFTNLL